MSLNMCFNKYEQQPKQEDQYKEIVEDLKNDIGCQLNGSFNIDKVSGNFHLSFHNYMDHYRKLVKQDHDTFLKLNLSYEIIDLYFGSLQNESKMPKIKKLLKEMKLDNELLNNYVDH